MTEQAYWENWKKNNIHHGPEDKCCECEEEIEMMRAYTASVEIDGKRHWYNGHKYCVMATVNRIKREHENQKKNIDHKNLLKKRDDDFIEEKVEQLEYIVKKNRPGKNFTMGIDIGHGSFTKGKR